MLQKRSFLAGGVFHWIQTLGHWLMAQTSTEFHLSKNKSGWFNGIGLDLQTDFATNCVFYLFRRNPQYKKHKTWDGDGILTVNEASEALLYNTDGQM